MVQWPDALVREIAERRVLLFIGAGISKAAYSAMPTWNGLLEGMASKLKKGTDKKLVSQMIRQNNLLDAAQIISDGLVKADLNAKLRATFQPIPTPHHHIYKDILLMDLKTIVTTNYDELLEKNFDHFSGGNQAYSVLKYTSKDVLEHLRSPSRILLKMHGCITEPASVVLDRSSYFTARQGNRGFFDILSALFSVNTVLFLGYSLGDPDMQIILENINSTSPSNHGHYTLIPKQKHRSIVGSLKRSYNIDCIEYPPGQHEKVPSYIESLSSEVLDIRRSRGLS